MSTGRGQTEANAEAGERPNPAGRAARGSGVLAPGERVGEPWILDAAGVSGWKDVFGLTYGAPGPGEDATEFSLMFNPILPQGSPEKGHHRQRSWR